MGLDLETPGPGPGLKAGTSPLSHPGIPGLKAGTSPLSHPGIPNLGFLIHKVQLTTEPPAMVVSRIQWDKVR